MQTRNGSTDVFISYRWSDESLEARQLQIMLKQYLGADRVFFDNRSMDYGDVFPEQLDQALGQCRLLLAVIDSEWLSKLEKRDPKKPDYVVHEIATALERRIPVWPLLVGSATMPMEDQLPEQIKRLAGCRSMPLRHPFIEDDYRSLRVGIDRHLYDISEKTTTFLPTHKNNPLIYAPKLANVPRPVLIQEIRAVLETPGKTRKVALTGMPGCGKTELALAYAREAQGRYHTLLWLTGAPDIIDEATDREAFLIQQLQVISDALELSSETKDVNTLFFGIQDKLDVKGHWLLIFDNASEEHDDFIAQDFRNGDLLLTTRNRNLREVTCLLMDNSKLTQDQGVWLFLSCAGRLKPDQPLEKAEKSEMDAAIQFCAELDYLPLALTLIGNYAKTVSTLANFLIEYRRNKADYLKHKSKAQNSFPETSIFETLSLALNQVSVQAKSLLQTCAFLPPEDIPEQLYTGHPDVWLDPLGQAAARPYDWHTKVLQPCFELSLLHRTQQTDATFSMHRLIQEIIRQMLTPKETLAIIRQIARAINMHLAGLEMPRDQAILNQIWSQAMTTITLCNAKRIALPHGPQTGYSLRTFSDDLKVQEALRDGESWEALFGIKDVDYTTLYHGLHALEDTRTKVKIRRVIASLQRVCRAPQEAQIALCCMFFVTHYWWDIYLPGDDFCQPLVAMWESQVHASETDAFIQALNQIQANYPVERNWKVLNTVPDAWTKVAEAIITLRHLLSLDTEKANTPARRYVKSITNLYLATARSYGAFSETPDLPPISVLYQEAQELLSENKDHFHQNWGLYEWASGIWQSERSPEALALCKKALDGILLEAGDPVKEGFEIDSELTARCYHLLGDCLTAAQETQGQAWPCYCAAIMAGATFLLKDKDDYTREFYGEMTERFQAWWDMLSAEEAARLAHQVCQFWDIGDGTLYPSVPSKEEIDEARKTGQASPFLEHVRTRLLALPAVREALLETPDYTDPPQFRRVVDTLVKLAGAEAKG